MSNHFPPFGEDRAMALRVAAVVGAVNLIPPEWLFRTTRGGEGEALARHELAYLLHTACGLSLNRIGAVLGRDRSSVSYAVRAIEEGLDDTGRAERMERLTKIARELVEIGAAQDGAIASLVKRELAR